MEGPAMGHSCSVFYKSRAMMADICLEVHRVINNSPQSVYVAGHEVKIFIKNEIITCSLGCKR